MRSKIVQGRILRTEAVLYQEEDGRGNYLLHRLFAVQGHSLGATTQGDSMLLGVGLGSMKLTLRIAANDFPGRRANPGFGLRLIYTDEHNLYDTIVGVSFPTSDRSSDEVISCNVVKDDEATAVSP